MEHRNVPFLLITANVGSIFEDPSCMLKVWCQEFLLLVSTLNPKFIALHCQEVGGKNYENSMKHVADFINLLMASEELRLFGKVRIFLDEDYSSAEHFTALGNFYFIHDSLRDVKMWNFKDLKFEDVLDKEIHSGNIESVATKEKAKFPQSYFPECKWSRKGFLRTRWSVNSTVLDLINIHLFHDASNFVAMESFPSIYSKNRRKALEYVLHRFHNDNFESVPYFLFGDFNFRPDTKSVIQNLTEGLTAVHIQTNRSNDHTKLEYNNGKNELILTLGKKEFSHTDHQNIFLKPSESWLKGFDKEFEAFEDKLEEFPISFPPSYPFEENISSPTSYMKTRCPAWCDRILFSHTAKKLIHETEPIEYNLLGRDICMGDHKPVYLKLVLIGNSGIVKCCDHAPFTCLPACRCYQMYPPTVTINVTEDVDLYGFKNSYPDLVDSKLLHEPITKDMLLHDPYTPESADSRSPNPEKNELTKDAQTKDSSVEPEQLKSRLENILMFERLRKAYDVYPAKMKRSVSQGIRTVGYSEGFILSTDGFKSEDFKAEDFKAEDFKAEGRESEVLKLEDCKSDDGEFDNKDSKFNCEAIHSKLGARRIRPESLDILRSANSQSQDKNSHVNNSQTHEINSQSHANSRSNKSRPLHKIRHLKETKSIQSDDGFFRSRAMTEIPKSNKRVRIISLPSVQSRLRLESHHSSSEEDWFEIDEGLTNGQKCDSCENLGTYKAKCDCMIYNVSVSQYNDGVINYNEGVQKYNEKHMKECDCTKKCDCAKKCDCTKKCGCTEKCDCTKKCGCTKKCDCSKELNCKKSNSGKENERCDCYKESDVYIQAEGDDPYLEEVRKKSRKSTSSKDTNVLGACCCLL